MGKTNKAFTGACGEFYVAAYLSRHDMIVALPRGGVQGIDLLVAVGSRNFGIQIKTTPNAYGKDKGGEYFSWVQKYPDAGNIGHDSLWYVYVNLNDWLQTEGSQPDIYFIPSTRVMQRMQQLREQAPNPWREHFWMPISDFPQYKNELGIGQLLSAMSAAQNSDSYKP